MKKLFLLILPVLAVTFNSCSKDDDGNGSGDNVALVKKISNGDWSMEFQYDNQQRVIKGIERDGGYTSNINFTYSNDKITVAGEDGDYTGEYIFNNDGYLTQFNDRDEQILFTYTNGYVSKAVEDDEYTTNYLWSDGNMIKSTFSDGDVNSYTYTNHLNKTNMPHPDFLLDWDVPLMFKGAFCKNLPSSLTREYGNSEDDVRTYSYTFNSDGNPTEIKRTDSDGYTSVTYLTYY